MENKKVKSASSSSKREGTQNKKTTTKVKTDVKKTNKVSNKSGSKIQTTNKIKLDKELLESLKKKDALINKTIEIKIIKEPKFINTYKSLKTKRSINFQNTYKSLETERKEDEQEHSDDVLKEIFLTDKKQKKSKRKYALATIIISVLFFILTLLFILLYQTFNDEEYHKPQVKVDETKKIDKDTKLEVLKQLYEENSDLIGWLTIDGTKIDYPVMYTKGEDYYLYRDFYKKKYNPGTLFVDKYNTVNPRDTNLIIHGHNMDDGTMFHDLMNFKDEDFYKTHKTFTFYTLDEKQDYEIVSVFLSKVYNVDENVFKYYKFYNADAEDEFNDFINNIKKMEIYKTNVNASYGDELITLSTCEYSVENGRLVIVAKKKKAD